MRRITNNTLSRIMNGESVRKVIDESCIQEKKFTKGSGKRINFEDDLVIVYDAKTGEVLYKGLEDYEDMKDEDWKWDDSIGAYRFGDFIKDCVG